MSVRNRYYQKDKTSQINYNNSLSLKENGIIQINSFTKDQQQIQEQQYQLQQQQQSSKQKKSNQNSIKIYKQSQQQSLPKTKYNRTSNSIGISSSKQSYSNSNSQGSNNFNQRKNSTSSTRKQSPERQIILKTNMNELNYPKYMLDLSDYDNNISSNLSSNQNSQAMMSLKRKMKFNLIKNAYDKRHSSLNRSAAIYATDKMQRIEQYYHTNNQTPSNVARGRISYRKNRYDKLDSFSIKQNKSYNDHQRMESAMSNIDDQLSFYDKTSACDFNKILHSNLETQKNESYSVLDQCQLGKTPQKINKANTYQPGQLRNTKSAFANELLEKGKILFKDNKLDEAIHAFKEAQNNDSKILECNYLLGTCYLGKSDYDNAIREFLYIIDKNQNYRKNIYLLASIAYKKLNNIQGAIKLLNKAIVKYPQYYDAYIYRGKLYIKEKKWEKALADFTTASQINPERGLAYLGKADCLRYMGQNQKATEIYTKALESKDFVQSAALLKRAISYIDCKNFQKAMDDLQQVIQVEEQNSEAYYFKGLCQVKQKNHAEALLSFEQAIKHNNSKKAVTKSIYEVAKIYIEMRDFYSAFHALNRADFFDVDKKVLEKFRLFTEGVIFLMKRKYKDALDNFNEIQKNYQLGDFLKPLFHAYRGYGYFCLGKHQSALYDYMAVENMTQQEDKKSQYNRLLCEGILSVQSNNLENGLQHFSQAELLIKNKQEPSFYKGVSIIRNAFKSFPNDLQKKSDVILEGLQDIDKCISISDQNANIFYYRALIRCYLLYYDEAIGDIDKAIEKSEDNVPKYFFLRGVIFGCSKRYKQAINDLSICIQLDENFSEAYLERAKNYQYEEDSNSAFADLQKYISQKPNDPQIHYWAGNLLFNNDAHEDAIKAFSHSDNINKDKQLLFHRAQCYLYLGNIKEALDDINRLIELGSSKQYQFDKLILEGLTNMIELKNYKEAQEKFIQLSNGKGKVGTLFKEHDLYLYMGVEKFYEHQYEQATKEFQKALFIKKEFEDAYKLIKDSSNSIMNSSDELRLENDEKNIFDQEEDSFTQPQIQYNILICHLQMKNYKQAHELALKIQNNINESYTQQFSNFIRIIQNEIDNEQKNHQAEEQKPDFKFFSSENKLSEQFPSFRLPIDNLKNIDFHLTFHLPKIKPPSLHPQFDVSLLENFDLADIENKPEAPWIKRTDDGIIFTDNIQIFESLDLDTEEKDKDKEQQQQQPKDYQKMKEFDDFDDIYQKSPDYNDSHEVDMEKKTDLLSLKEQLALDKHIEDKLNKIMNQKNKQTQITQNQNLK